MLSVVKTRPEPGIEILDRPEPIITHEDHVLLEVAACGVCGQDQPGRRPLFEKRAAGTPAGRAATPKEVAAVVRFVVSEAASYLIGEVITVSGGL